VAFELDYARVEIVQLDGTKASITVPVSTICNLGI
jgi:hypothetical protein